MVYSAEKINVMQHLGNGLSVESLCKVCEITYNQLCQLAQDNMDLYHELKKWYKRYDFIPQTEEAKPIEDKPLENKYIPEVKPKKSKKKVETK